VLRLIAASVGTVVAGVVEEDVGAGGAWWSNPCEAIDRTTDLWYIITMGVTMDILV
jgi:hypothetical protein